MERRARRADAHSSCCFGAKRRRAVTLRSRAQLALVNHTSHRSYTVLIVGILLMIQKTHGPAFHPAPAPTLPPTPLHNLALTIAALAASALAYALAAFRVAASSAAARTPPCRSSLETSGAKSCPDLATSAARARTRCSCCR